MADSSIRFERSHKRGREDAPPSLEAFEERDNIQKSMGLAAIESECANLIANHGTFESFFHCFTNTFDLDANSLDKKMAKRINRYERSLEGRILLFFLIDEIVSGERCKYTTTEISKGINRILTGNRFQTEKDNVSRYFNFRSHPYYRAFPGEGVVKIPLSATGRSLAVQLARIEQKHVTPCP